MIHEKKDAMFVLGQVLITSNARGTLDNQDIFAAVGRHIAGDWGDCCPEDWEANQQALKEDDRLFSVYHDKNGVKFWVITEWDRSATTILLPEDY